MSECGRFSSTLLGCGGGQGGKEQPKARQYNTTQPPTKGSSRRTNQRMSEVLQSQSTVDKHSLSIFISLITASSTAGDSVDDGRSRCMATSWEAQEMESSSGWQKCDERPAY